MTHREGVDVSLAELIAMRGHRRTPRLGESSPRTDGLAVNKAVSRGLDVAEVRRYQPGDEARAIDWKVTARRGQTHVKVFEDERARAVYLLVDLRRALHFGTRTCFKSVLAARLAAGLGWRAWHAGDRVGAWILAGDQLHRLTDVAQESGVRRLCHALVARHASTGAADTLTLTEALRGVGRGALSKADWHVISDFSDGDLVLPSRVSVTCWHLVDPLDSELPARSAWVRDNRGQRRLAVTRRARQRHSERHTARVAALRAACTRPAHRYVQVSTVDGDLPALRRMLAAGVGG
ncbi:MAG: DUF58 domain-containing protein [Pseudomonadota bacterium]